MKEKKRIFNRPAKRINQKGNQNESSGVSVNQEDGKRLGWLKDHQFVERGVRWCCPQWVADADLS